MTRSTAPVAPGTNMPHSYDLTVNVTNTTGQPLTTGVTEQAVLYDQAGPVMTQQDS